MLENFSSAQESGGQKNDSFVQFNAYTENVILVFIFHHGQSGCYNSICLYEEDISLPDNPVQEKQAKRQVLASQ